MTTTKGKSVVLTLDGAYVMRGNQVVCKAINPDDAELIVKAVNQHAALLAVVDAAKHVLYVAEDCQTVQPSKQICVSFVDNMLRRALSNLQSIKG